MVTEAEAFCLSCGVARNAGSTCDYCGRLYVSAEKASTAKPKALRALPEKYQIRKNNNETVISWKWARGKSSWFMIGFSLFWIGMALRMGDVTLFLTDPVETFPVPLIPILIGIFLLCNALIKIANSTSIHASKQSLYIKHYPIPSRRSLRFTRNEIEQIYVSKVRRSNEHRSWDAPILQLATNSGVRHAILSGYNEAQFETFETLRSELLSALDIEPIQVAGSHDRTEG